jgi:hypothetical protein
VVGDARAEKSRRIVVRNAPLPTLWSSEHVLPPTGELDMTRRALRTVAALALLTALVGGCGNGDSAAQRAATSTTQTDDPTTVIATTTTMVASLPPIRSDDSCHVDISGDVSVSYDSRGGFSNISYGPWVPGGGTVVGITLDDTLFMLNCDRGDGLLVRFSLATGQHLAMQPATFSIRKADNVMGGYSNDPPPIEVSPFIGTGDYKYAVSQDSTFAITEFDDEHIAGSFRVTVSEAKRGVLSDGLPPKTAVIAGTFELKNPN